MKALKDYNPVNIRQRCYRVVYMNELGKTVSHDRWDYSLGDATRYARNQLKRVNRPDWKIVRIQEVK